MNHSARDPTLAGRDRVWPDRSASNGRHLQTGRRTSLTTSRQAGPGPSRTERATVPFHPYSASVRISDRCVPLPGLKSRTFPVMSGAPAAGRLTSLSRVQAGPSRGAFFAPFGPVPALRGDSTGHLLPDGTRAGRGGTGRPRQPLLPEVTPLSPGRQDNMTTQLEYRIIQLGSRLASCSIVFCVGSDGSFVWGGVLGGTVTWAGSWRATPAPPCPLRDLSTDGRGTHLGMRADRRGEQRRKVFRETSNTPSIAHIFPDEGIPQIPLDRAAMAGEEGPFLLRWNTLTEHPFFKNLSKFAEKIAALSILMAS